MKKTITSIILVLLIPVFLSTATKVIPLPGVNKPEQQVAIDKDRMYVIEGTTIYIYSLKDFKLIKKFGKRGEGPQEFMTSAFMGPIGTLWVDVQSDYILVKSLGKLSWFSKNGAFIKEAKSPAPFMWAFLTHGEQYAGLKYESGNVRYLVLMAYNNKLEEIKEIERMKDSFQMGKGFEVLKKNPIQRVYKDRLYTAWDNDFRIKVFDTGYKLLYSIKHPIERVKVTDDMKKDILHFFKTSQMTKNFFEMMKPIKFPEYFPAVANMFITGDKIYVVTFKTAPVDDTTDNNKIMVFDLKGKFLRNILLPVRMMDPIQSYPYTIHEGKMYQLVENEDEEAYEVHITDIK